MRLSRLELISRLARLRDQEAGRVVEESKAALESSEQQAEMLRGYRHTLSASRFAGNRADGQTLKSFASFAHIADKAHEQAQDEANNSRTIYEEALQDWYAKHHKQKALSDKFADARRREQRDRLDKQDEAGQQAQAANRK